MEGQRIQNGLHERVISGILAGNAAILRADLDREGGIALLAALLDKNLAQQITGIAAVEVDLHFFVAITAAGRRLAARRRRWGKGNGCTERTYGKSDPAGSISQRRR